MRGGTYLIAGRWIVSPLKSVSARMEMLRAIEYYDSPIGLRYVINCDASLRSPAVSPDV